MAAYLLAGPSNDAPMTDFTFTGPDGKSHVVTGPEGATQDQAFKILQQHLGAQPGGAPGGALPVIQDNGPLSHLDISPFGGSPGGGHPLGDLWSKALANLPQGIQDQARSLMPSWSHNGPSYNPLRPADPRNMPNDAINPVGNDAQMVGATAAAGGMGGLAAGARALQGAPQPAPAPGPSVPSIQPPAPPVKPGPTPGPWGDHPAPAPVIRGPGGKWMPNPEAQPQPAPAASPAPASGIPSNPITTAPPLPGTSPAQLQFLKQAVPEGAGLLGHLLGGPVGGILGRAGTRAMMRGMQ